MGIAAVSLRTIQRTFQKDKLRLVTWLSARASATSKGICFVESREFPFAAAHLSRQHAAGSLRNTRSRQGAFQRNMLRGFLA